MKVLLFVNSECNANCRHCYLSYSGARNPENTLEAVKQLQSRGHEVIIAGSETLLNPDYLKAYQQAGQKYLLTNGVILDQNKSLYDLLKKYGIEELVLSLHFGMQKDLKSISENLVARVIRESKIRGFEITLLTVITSRNCNSLADMCDKAAEYGVDMWQPIRFVATGRGNGRKELNLTPDQLKAFFSEIGNLKRKYKSVLKIRPEGNFGPSPGSKGEKLAKRNEYCPAGKSLIAIDPQDNIYACPFLMQPENVIGIYKDGNIIIQKELSEKRRDTCIAHLIV